MATSIQNVVREHRHRVYTLACYTLGSAADAEDVTQEVLVRYWHRAEEIDPERVEGWLARVTVNACRDLFRKRARNRETSDLENTLEAQPSSTPTPSARIEQTELQQEVRRLLAELQEPFRSVVVLREIQGKTYAEIAESLDMPLSSVRVNLHRGRRMLAQRLRPEPRTESNRTNDPTTCSHEA